MEHLPVIATFSTDTGTLPLYLSPEERAQSLYIIGASGSGKSTLISNLILSDMLEGHGVVVADPHGDLAPRIIDSVPTWRTEETCYIDVADGTHAVGFNPLAGVPPERRSLAAEEMIAAMKHQWADSWGPRLEDILRFGLLSLMETPGATIADLQRLYRDDAYRERIVERVTDRTTRAFWELEYGSWDKQQRADYPVSLLNKVRAFVASPAVRAILCQRTPRLDLRKRLDLGGITVVNVSKGIVGAQVSSLIGAFFVSYLVSTALSRADQPEEERTPVRVHIDEAQTVSTGAMESLLSECRKFGTQTCLANQTLAQLTDEVRAAILTNARTLIAFNTSAADEDVLAPEIAPGLSGLAGQLPYHAVIRRAHLVNRIETTPFQPITTGRFETVRAASRMRFAREKKVIERGL